METLTYILIGVIVVLVIGIVWLLSKLPRWPG